MSAAAAAPKPWSWWVSSTDLDTEVRGAMNSANVMDIDAAHDLLIGALDVRYWHLTSFMPLECRRNRINSGQTAPSGFTDSVAIDPKRTRGILKAEPFLRIQCKSIKPGIAELK
jgi:hypothetical protein